MQTRIKEFFCPGVAGHDADHWSQHHFNSAAGDLKPKLEQFRQDLLLVTADRWAIIAIDLISGQMDQVIAEVATMTENI
jgi:hypothetical protein